MYIFTNCLIIEDEDRFRELIYDKGIIELLVKSLSIVTKDDLLSRILESINFALNFDLYVDKEGDGLFSIMDAFQEFSIE